MADYDDLPAVQDGGDLAPYYTPTPSPLPASAPAGLPADFLDDRADHDQGVTLFGQAMPPAAAQQVMRELEENFSRDMSRAVPAAHARLAVDLFKQMATAPMPRDVAAAHRYDLRGLAFLKEDHPHIASFLNAMHAHGVPQSSAYTMLRWYSDLSKKVFEQQQQRNASEFSDAELDQIDARADADREAGLDALRTLWGHEMPTRLALVHQYVRGLPAAARDHLQNAVLPGNKLAANDVGVVQALYAEAVGQMPSGSNLQKEIAKIEHTLRTDRKLYNRDPMMQARYLELLRLRDGS